MDVAGTLPGAGSPFRIVYLTEVTESRLARDLGLAPIDLPPDLAVGEGTWKGQPIRIETRAYRGGPIGYARFVRLVGPDLEIGNLLARPDPAYPLPIFGADLVALGKGSAMLAVDLSPTLRAGSERDAQLADLAARRATAPDLPPGGDLPAWCLDWFSPHALYTRFGVDRIAEASAAFDDFVAAFVRLVQEVRPRPDRAPTVAAAIDGYAAAHLRDDKGLGLLGRMFGQEWAGRYLSEVLFPPLSLEAIGDRPRG